MEERWTAFNGQAAEAVVDVVAVAAFLEPACTCGRLCMGRYRFWYEHAGSLFASALRDLARRAVELRAPMRAMTD